MMKYSTLKLSLNLMKKIQIADLFAGVGGIRHGFEKAACAIDSDIKVECVFTSEWDKFACQTYRNNFLNDHHDPLNDITLQDEKKVEPFDVMLAGFPCQAFSIAGKRGGFEDIRGTLFFDVARLIDHHKPKAFLLENVKGLVNHRGGKTLATILSVLKNDLGYSSTQFKVLNAKHYGVPQNRERVYIVGFRDGGGDFEFPTDDVVTTSINDIMEKDAVSVKYYISDVYLKSMKEHKKRHKAKGNGFGYEIRAIDGIANAIVVGGMGRERNLLIDKRLKNFIPVTNIKGKVNREGIRRMTPIEWERLQGFPDNWTQGASDAQRFKQLGNSVAVPVIEQVAKNIIKELLNPTEFIVKEPAQKTLQFDF
jgi:DNA (cytosine-5)-methyltransferase 1